jgi:hypothetical protein
MLCVNERPRLSHLSYTRWFKYDRDWFVCKQAALRPGHIWTTLYIVCHNGHSWTVWLIINQLVQNFCEGRTGFHMICTCGHLTVILGRVFLYNCSYTTNSLGISKQVVLWKDSAVKGWSLIRLWWNFVLEPFRKMSMNLTVTDQLALYLNNFWYGVLSSGFWHCVHQ